MARDDDSIAPLLTIQLGAASRGLAGETLALAQPVRPIRDEAAVCRSGGRMQPTQEFGRARVKGGAAPRPGIDCSSVPLRRLHAS